MQVKSRSVADPNLWMMCGAWFRVMTLLVTDLVMTCLCIFLTPPSMRIDRVWQQWVRSSCHTTCTSTPASSARPRLTIQCTPSLLSTPYCWYHIQYDKNLTRLQTNSKHSAVGGWVRYFGQKHFLSPSHILCCSWTGRQRQRWERQTSTPPLNPSSPSLSGATNISN